MKNTHLKVWLIATITVAIIGIVIRSFWQIAVIPTSGTMIIFVPLIVALVGANALFIYIAIKPQRLRNLFSLIVITVALTGGLVAGVSHFVNFIISPRAEPFLSKIIGACVLSSSISAYFLMLYYLWSRRKTKESHG
jgi:hypothetical protein